MVAAADEMLAFFGDTETPGTANAIAQAARNGAAIEGATIYLTISPCYDCFKMMVNAGIQGVVYKQFYSSRYGLSKAVLDLSKKTGVKIKVFK